MTGAVASVRPFFSLLLRPASLMTVWLMALAIAGAGLHLGDAGLALALSGHPDRPLDESALAAMATQLVLHGSALLSVALGFQAVLASGEVDASPRLSLSPGFRASMRNGLLLCLVLVPMLTWLWAHRWAPPTAMNRALLLAPWWFALASWGRLLARGPRWLEWSPVGVLVVLIAKPTWYVAAVSAMGWPGAVLLLAAAPVAVFTSWSPNTREQAWLRAQRAADPWAWMANLVAADGPDTEDAAGSTPSAWWWLRRLEWERPSLVRGLPARVAFLAVWVAVFLFYAQTNPGLVAMIFGQQGLTAGGPLLYPLSRRMRARLLFLDQLRELVVFAAVVAVVGAVYTTLHLPMLEELRAGRAPLAVQLGATLALWPLAHAARLFAPMGGVEAGARGVAGGGVARGWGTRAVLLHMALGMFALSLGVVFLARAVWGWARGDAMTTAGLLTAVGVAMQVAFYLVGRWRMARRDLAPTGA